MRSEVARSGVREVKAVVVRVGGAEKKVEELQRERDGRDSLLSTTNNSSVDQQHRTTFCALKYVRSSYKPAILVFWYHGIK